MCWSQRGRQPSLPSTCRHLLSWLVSHCGQYVCWQVAPGGERGYVVRHDGRLAPLEAECDLRDVGWEPAVVVWCPVAKGQQLLVKVPPPAHLVKEAPTSMALVACHLLTPWLALWCRQATEEGVLSLRCPGARPQQPPSSAGARGAH